ncbi:heavy-metal-associated domain-containing protein [Enterococcus sp. LJL99]
MEKTVTINGMKCDGCVTKVKENFEKIAGVESVAVSLENKNAVIKSDRELSQDELQQALVDTKFIVGA